MPDNDRSRPHGVDALPVSKRRSAYHQLAAPEETYTRAWIETDWEMGSRKHNRLPCWLRHIAKMALLFDWCLLAYYFEGMARATLRGPAWSIACGALLATIVAATAFSYLVSTGRRLRTYKNHDGTVSVREADALTQILLITAVAGLAILGTIAFFFTRSQMVYLLGPPLDLASLITALASSVLVFSGNCLIIGIYAKDGSNELHRLNKLSRAARCSVNSAPTQ